jgi:hypothetical protein
VNQLWNLLKGTFIFHSQYSVWYLIVSPKVHTEAYHENISRLSIFYPSKVPSGKQLMHIHLFMLAKGDLTKFIISLPACEEESTSPVPSPQASIMALIRPPHMSSRD